MNRQIHHWLVLDFESNERDPRDTGYNLLNITAKFEAGLDEVKNSEGMNHALRNLRHVESSTALKA